MLLPRTIRNSGSFFLSCLILLSFSVVVLAQDDVNERDGSPGDREGYTPDWEPLEEEDEPFATGWALQLDNDSFAPGPSDQNYTGGKALTISGRRVTEWPWSLDPILGALDSLTGFGGLGAEELSFTRHSFALGDQAFTPKDISDPDPIEDDHPYASLVFFKNTRKRTLPEQGITYTSSFTLGVLGLDAVPELQDSIHEISDSTDPEGWDHQISDGGEPTFRYEVNRKSVIYSNHTDEEFGTLDVQSSLGGSVGYITQINTGFHWRLGNLKSEAWEFTSNFGEFTAQSSPRDLDETDTPFFKEYFFWGGVEGIVRGYNSFLEGQFRDSDVTFDRSDLNSVIGRASLGLSGLFANGTRITLGVHVQSREVEDASREFPRWGSIIISREF